MNVKTARGVVVVIGGLIAAIGLMMIVTKAVCLRSNSSQSCICYAPAIDASIAERVEKQLARLARRPLEVVAVNLDTFDRRDREWEARFRRLADHELVMLIGDSMPSKEAVSSLVQHISGRDMQIASFVEGNSVKVAVMYDRVRLRSEGEYSRAKEAKVTDGSDQRRDPVETIVLFRAAENVHFYLASVILQKGVNFDDRGMDNWHTDTRGILAANRDGIVIVSALKEDSDVSAGTASIIGFVEECGAALVLSLSGEILSGKANECGDPDDLRSMHAAILTGAAVRWQAKIVSGDVHRRTSQCRNAASGRIRKLQITPWE